ncbi:hypothetical protein BC938DRAFT_472622 [Jimgerdemannia flammicorona]|uniref:Uncharacterized protein n=1 Tax=Jimgerdemannia flammicorona TaxID=994334 RepID=A0A433Q5Q5_9FUNG|nr:hypothetical protein BC938DRAFT_472622 [Jimgerdemannia flammicorona]
MGCATSMNFGHSSPDKPRWRARENVTNAYGHFAEFYTLNHCFLATASAMSLATSRADCGFRERDKVH